MRWEFDLGEEGTPVRWCVTSGWPRASSPRNPSALARADVCREGRAVGSDACRQAIATASLEEGCIRRRRHDILGPPPLGRSGSSMHPRTSPPRPAARSPASPPAARVAPCAARFLSPRLPVWLVGDYEAALQPSSISSRVPCRHAMSRRIPPRTPPKLCALRRSRRPTLLPP